ncbi:hypothetical protein RchiOBHm_Chr5g0037941 [Rosa chinensis]|uniref:PB1-like domain-containing protein n=1 Tax=Rosa chinensis TaxID=74649 RepID=A0A2P6QBV7_ROSCH|nr:hypothetical protein RchiOBHm_Chr5g0037941 [Rosa chinensis]
MSEISNKWRYFRLDGEPPTPHEPNWFTIAFHHGGRFYRLGSGNRFYKGGEVAYVDKMETDKISWTCLNCFAEDLGYRHPPIAY